MDLKSLKRKELQSLCKKHGISANIASSLMIEKLESILENEQKNQRKGCLKRSGESSSENLGISQKNVTFVVDESKGIDEKQNRASKRKTVRAKSEINTSENIATEPVKRTTRSKGLAESVMWSPVIEKKKVKNAPVNVEENVTRPLRNRSVTANDNDSKGGRKRKVIESKEEVTTKTVEVSRSTRGRSKEGVNVEIQSGKSSEKEEETVNLEVLPSRSRSTRTSKKLDVNEVGKADEVQGNKRRKVDEAINESVQLTRSTRTTSSVLLDVGTCVFHPGKADEKSKVQVAKVKRSMRGKGKIAKVEEENPSAIAEKSKKEKSENQTKIADVTSSRTTRGSSKIPNNEVSLPSDEAKESKREVKKEINAKRPTRSGSQTTEDIIPVEKSKKEKVKKQDVSSHAKRSTRSGSQASEDIVPVEKSKEKVKKQEDAIGLAKKSIRSDSKASEDIVPVEISGTLKTGKQLTRKAAAANENILTNVRSTRKASKKSDDLDSLPAFDSDKLLGMQASEVLTETENVMTPTSKSTRSSVKAVESEIPSPKFGHKSAENIPSPKLETGHKSVENVLSHAPGKTTRQSRMSGKAKISPKGGKHVSTSKVKATKSSSKLLEDVPKKHKSVTKETKQIIGDATTPSRSTRSSTKLDTPVEHGDSHHEIVMTSSRRSAEKVSEGKDAAEEAASYKLIKGAKSNASIIDGDVQTTKDDAQTSVARKSLRSSSKQGDANVGKSTGKKRTRTAAMEEDLPTSLIKSSKRSRKDLLVDGNSSGIVDSSIKQLTDSEALGSDEVTETEPSKLAILTEAKSGSILEQCSVPESGPSQLDKIENVSGSNLGSNINENLSPENELEKLHLKGKIIDESMNVSVDEVTETEPLESTTSTEIKEGNALDQSNVPESKLTQLDDVEGADGLDFGSNIDVSVDKVTETGPLGSATPTETETGVSLDQSNVPESKASQLDDIGDADGLNLGSSIDASADKETEIEPLESVTLTETVTGNILDQSNVPESKLSQLDDTGDADGLNLGSSSDVYADKETEIEPLESVTLTETVTGNILEQINVPESKPSELDDLENADGLNLGSSVGVAVDKVTEIEPLESETPTELKDGNAANVINEKNVPESKTSQRDNLVDIDGSNLGSSVNLSADKVTDTEPVELVTLTEIKDENVTDQNSVPESRPYRLDNVEDADGSNLGSNTNVSEDKATETELLESVKLTDTEAENILGQINVPDSRASHLDNLDNASDLNLDLDVNEHLSSEIDIDMVYLKDKVIDESVEISIDRESKDIHKGSIEPKSGEGIGCSSENLLESNEVYKSDDATLYDITVEEPEVEEVSEGTNVNCSPCSPNLMASPMIEINTFNMGNVTPAEAQGEALADFGTRMGDSGYIRNLEKRFSTETETTHEGCEGTNVDHLPASPNVTSSVLSDVNLEEPNTAVDTLNLCQATPNFDDCSFEADDKYKQTPVGIEICKTDTGDQLYSQSLARENNFNLETESPSPNINSQLGLERKQKVEENAVFVEDNSSSAFAKKDSDNIGDTGLPKVADMSMNLERESSMEHVDELRDAVMDDVAPKCSIPEQIQHETEICNVGLEIPSHTQIPTNEYNFISSTESPAREIGSQMYVKDTETIRDNLVTTEGNISSVPEKGKTEYFDDMDPSNFIDISMNVGVGGSSVQAAENFSEPDMGTILPKSSIPGSFNSANTSIDVSLEKETIFPKNDANIDGEGDTIMKELNDSSQENLGHFDESSESQDESLWKQYSAPITREETTQENSSFMENECRDNISSRVTSSVDIHEKDNNSKEIDIEDNNASIDFDIGINLSTRNSLATPTASSNFDDEDNTQDGSNRYQGSFGSLGHEFMVEETWVSRSRISQVQHYVNDNANVDQEENTEHDRAGFVSNLSITDEFRNVSGISDAETQEDCPRENRSPEFGNMFGDFEATISATRLSSQEERATSVQRSTEVSYLTRDDFLSNMGNAKYEGSTAVGNKNKEIMATDEKESSASQSEDQEQRKSPVRESPGRFSYF